MHSLLEQYVEKVTVHLHALPQEKREDEIEELSAHLQALATAHQELGISEEAAARATIQQFGAAQEIGHNLLRAWLAGKERIPGTLREAILYSLLLYTAVGLAANLCMRGASYLGLSFHSSMVISFVAALTLIPFVIGAGTGFLAPRRALPGTAIGITLFTMGIVILTFVHLQQMSQELHKTFTLGPFNFVLFAIPILVATASTRIGQQGRRRWSRRLALR